VTATNNIEIDIHVRADPDSATWRTSGGDDTRATAGARIPPPPAPLPGSSISDAALMAMLARGHFTALDMLMGRHRRSALALATGICGASLAEEAVQDAFLQVTRASGRYRPEIGSVRNWMLGIVRLRAIDALRHDARHVRRRAGAEELDAVPCAAKEVATIVVEREEAQTLRSRLRALPIEQAEIISMAYFDQLTHQEIAYTTGLPVGTVKGRIRLGLAKLRQPALSLS
jgi:RNA polymerase sigma-70 factor (ECF subfamily)